MSAPINVNAYSTLRAPVIPDCAREEVARRCVVTPDGDVDQEVLDHLHAMVSYASGDVEPNPMLDRLRDHIMHTVWHYTFSVDPGRVTELEVWGDRANAIMFRSDRGLTDPTGQPLLPATEESPARLPYLDSALERRRTQAALLRTRAVPAADEPPLVRAAEEVLPRSAQEVALRALGVVLSSYFAGAVLTKDPSQLNARDMRRDYPHSFEAMSELEQELFRGRDKDLADRLQWRLPEGEALLWALRQLPGRMPDSTPAAADVLRAAFSIPEEEFCGAPALRPLPDLLDEAEREAAMHHAFSSGIDASHSGMRPDVVAARHRALTWVLDQRTSWGQDDRPQGDE